MKKKLFLITAIFLTAAISANATENPATQPKKFFRNNKNNNILPLKQKEEMPTISKNNTFLLSQTSHQRALTGFTP